MKAGAVMNNWMILQRDFLGVTMEMCVPAGTLKPLKATIGLTVYVIQLQVTTVLGWLVVYPATSHLQQSPMFNMKLQ